MLSQTCEYALRAVACLARQPGEFVTASALAEATTVPPDYLSKVLQQLAGAKVVQGRRGVGGGYRLARDPKDINLHDIIDAMGVISRMRACPIGEERPGVCPLHDTMDRALEAAERVFRETTLADLIAKESQGEMCVKRCESVNGTSSTAASPGTAALGKPVAQTPPVLRQPARTPSTPGMREERLTRATLPSLSKDDDLSRDDSGEPIYTASGRLRAKPRRSLSDNNGH